jgi:hypothetical protein
MVIDTTWNYASDYASYCLGSYETQPPPSVPPRPNETLCQLNNCETNATPLPCFGLNDVALEWNPTLYDFDAESAITPWVLRDLFPEQIRHDLHTGPRILSSASQSSIGASGLLADEWPPFRPSESDESAISAVCERSPSSRAPTEHYSLIDSTLFSSLDSEIAGKCPHTLLHQSASCSGDVASGTIIPLEPTNAAANHPRKPRAKSRIPGTSVISLHDRQPASGNRPRKRRLGDGPDSDTRLPNTSRIRQRRRIGAGETCVRCRVNHEAVHTLFLLLPSSN